MKKTITALAIISVFLLAIPEALAQKECSSTMSTRNITLEGSSDNEAIKVEVEKDVKSLCVGINSTISSGFLTVEIYDPKGNKQGHFSVESQLSSGAKKKEEVCGQMHKVIKDPQKGKWVVKLKPKDVSGQIAINTSQLQ